MMSSITAAKKINIIYRVQFRKGLKREAKD